PREHAEGGRQDRARLASLVCGRSRQSPPFRLGRADAAGAWQRQPAPYAFAGRRVARDHAWERVHRCGRCKPPVAADPRLGAHERASLKPGRRRETALGMISDGSLAREVEMAHPFNVLFLCTGTSPASWNLSCRAMLTSTR